MLQQHIQQRDNDKHENIILFMRNCSRWQCLFCRIWLSYSQQYIFSRISGLSFLNLLMMFRTLDAIRTRISEWKKSIPGCRDTVTRFNVFLPKVGLAWTRKCSNPATVQMMAARPSVDTTARACLMPVSTLSRTGLLIRVKVVLSDNMVWPGVLPVFTADSGQTGPVNTQFNELFSLISTISY